MAKSVLAISKYPGYMSSGYKTSSAHRTNERNYGAKSRFKGGRRRASA